MRFSTVWPIALALISTPALAQGVKYSAPSNILACRAVEDADTFRKLLMQQDMEAVYRYREIKLKQGECADFTKGDMLTVMDVTAYDQYPYECSRLTGNPQCYWMPAFSFTRAK
jgi:hypothetical protein